jgi:uncharacterized protein YlbG (UPF0298 family)
MHAKEIQNQKSLGCIVKVTKHKSYTILYITKHDYYKIMLN